MDFDMSHPAKLPGVETATIDLSKLSEHCLNPHHPEGRHKARVFLSSLGIGQKESAWLANEILSALGAAEAILTAETPWGNQYRVDMEIKRDTRCAKVRTGWLCTAVQTRLTTCYVVGVCDESS
jgi:hypothetical protein